MITAIEQYKANAAEAAVRYLKSGMVIGLGHGSTAHYALTHLASLIQQGLLQDIYAVPCSNQVEEEARNLGIPLISLDERPTIDITIDGADEISADQGVIKGAGGALLREKIVAQVSSKEIIIADDRKISSRLGTVAAVPVEVLPFGWKTQRLYLEGLGAHVQQRLLPDGTPFHSEMGHYILDCTFGPIAQPHVLAAQLDERAGIIEHGLFLGLATLAIVAGAGGVREITLPVAY